MRDGDASLDALNTELADIMSDDVRECVDGWAAHVLILDRLAANRRRAEAAGWTSLALEREGDCGRFRLLGVPRGQVLRTEVPDADDPGEQADGRA